MNIRSLYRIIVLFSIIHWLPLRISAAENISDSISQKSKALRVVQVSTDSYTNQTVTTDVSITGSTVLTSNNVTVTSTGHLSMKAPNGVYITGPFDVVLGGTLDVSGADKVAVKIKYSYDASGNRILKEPN